MLKIKKILKNKYTLKIKEILHYLISLKYIGDLYNCPFCKTNFKKFFPSGENSEILKKYNVIGGGYIESSRCPRCYSNYRERLIYLYLKKNHSEIFKTKKILHIAPEKNLSKKLYKNKNYITADLNSKFVDLNLDITNINIDNNSMDVIICNHVLEHIPNDILAMKELYRILKKNGFAILQVPISLDIHNTIEDSTIVTEDDRLLHFGQIDHVRIYGRDYIDRLKSVGFSVDIINCSEIFDLNTINKYQLLEKEQIYLCKK